MAPSGSRWRLGAGLVVALALLLVLLRGLDPGALWRAAAGVPPGLWLLATTAVLASHLLRALRLQAEWQPRVGARLGSCLRLSLLHNAAVLLLPLRAGELGYPWWLQRRWGVPLAEGAASLLWLRLQDLLVLAALALLVWAPLPLALSAIGGGLVLGSTLLPALLCHAHVWVADPIRREGWRRRLALRLLQAVATRRGGRSSWVYAASNWSLRLLVVAGLLTWLLPVEVPDAISGALGGELAALLPLQAPAGLGTYEAGIWGGVQLLGSAPVVLPQLAGAALLIHLWWLLVSLGAALVALLLPRLRSRLARND